MIKLVGILIALLFAVPSVAAERQMDQLLKIGVNLDLARLKQPGGLCIKAYVPQDVAKRVSQLLSTIKTTGLKDELNHSPGAQSAFKAWLWCFGAARIALECRGILEFSTNGPLASRSWR